MLAGPEVATGKLDTTGRTFKRDNSVGQHCSRDNRTTIIGANLQLVMEGGLTIAGHRPSGHFVYSLGCTDILEPYSQGSEIPPSVS